MMSRIASNRIRGGSENGLRSDYQKRHGYRRHRRVSPPRRRRGQGRQGRGDRKSHRRRHGNDRCVGPDRRAGLRRSAYSLRCADLLGSISQLHFVARRYDRRDGKLRSRYRAVQAGGARGGSVGPGQRRGDSVRGAVEGDHAGSGRASRNSSRRQQSRRRNQSRVPGAADSVSALRAGRRVDGAGGHARRDGAGRGAAARGDRRGRVRIFDDHVAAAYRLPGTSAGVPAGVARRAEGLRQRAA